MKLDISDSKDRLDVLEGTTITSINEQISAINTSISDLKEMDETLGTYIKALEATSTDLQKQINDANAEIAKVEAALGEEISALEKSLLNELNTAKEAIEAELLAINNTLAELKKADEALDKKISDLQTYVDTQLTSTTNWANATFSTLAQYEQTQTEISTIKASIEQINAGMTALETRLNGKIAADIQTAVDALRSELSTDYITRIENAVNAVTQAYTAAISSAKDEITTAYTTAIATAIAESEANMQAWVNTVLTQGYYDIATIDGKLSALSGRLDETDSDLQKQITEQKTALEALKEELAKAYKKAIKEAIEENNGVISSEISEGLQTLENKLNTRLETIEATILALQNQINAVAADIAKILLQIEKLNESIAALEIEDGEITSMVSQLNEEFNRLLQDYESYKENTDELEQSILSDIANIYSVIATILDRLDVFLNGFSITFDNDEIGIIPGSVASVGFDVIGGTENTKVSALCQNGWQAKVSYNGVSRGVIRVTAPDPLTNDEILVLAYDGKSKTIMSTINCVTGVISPSVTAVEVGEVAGTVDVDLSTNFSYYNVRISENGRSWLSFLGTKSLRTDTITLAYTDNHGDMRQGTVEFLDEAGQCVSTIAVVQKESIFNGGTQAINLSKTETANSYIISEKGLYKFNATYKGNSQERISNAYEAYVGWESFGNDIAPNVGDLIKDVVLEDDFIYVKTADTFKEGNALVVVADREGEILWSWHIWLTDQPQAQVYFNNAGVMMDRNLGATSSTPGEIGSFGLLYQWGRKDPFLSASYSHYDDFGGVGYFIAASSTPWPSSVNSTSATGTIDFTVSNPATFIAAEVGKDWLYPGDPQVTDKTRWQSQKTMYDPCPVGWRVPDGGEAGVWSRASGCFPMEEAVSYDMASFGWDFSGKFGASQSIWYPASGFKMGDRIINGFGAYAMYHSTNYITTIVDGDEYNRFGGLIVLEDYGMYYFDAVGYMPTVGCSVRCQKE